MMSGLLALRWPLRVLPGLDDDDEVEDFLDGFEYRLSSEWLIGPDSLLLR